MCQQCNTQINKAGDHLDRIVEVQLETRKALPHYTSQQLVMRLQNCVIESLNEMDADKQSEAVADLALAYACAVTRLVAAQDVYGIRL